MFITLDCANMLPYNCVAPGWVASRACLWLFCKNYASRQLGDYPRSVYLRADFHRLSSLLWNTSQYPQLPWSWLGTITPYIGVAH
eukprot:COSAG01_NODE_284_length_19459_cov_64.204494_1_plen_84_part_10